MSFPLINKDFNKTETNFVMDIEENINENEFQPKMYNYFIFKSFNFNFLIIFSVKIYRKIKEKRERENYNNEEKYN
jgi:hypothetical protein